MRRVLFILAVSAITGCESIPSYVPAPTNTNLPLSSTAKNPTPAPSSQPSASPTPSIVEYSPFDSRSIKVIFIQDSQHQTIGTLYLNLKSLYSYDAIQSNLMFVYLNSAPLAGGTQVGCKTDYITIEDSDTNTHRLTIRQISQHLNPVFNYAGTLITVGPNTQSSWSEDPNSQCQDLYGTWNLEISPYSSSYHVMSIL